MDLLKINLLRGGIFKQIRFLFSAPQSAQTVVYISEAGNVSKELLSVDTGFVSSPKEEREWADLHSLKFQIWKDGQPIGESALVISDRSYLPLDPFETVKEKDKEKMASLGDIARMRHSQERSKASGVIDPKTKLAELIINSGFVMLGIFALVTLIQGC